MTGKHCGQQAYHPPDGNSNKPSSSPTNPYQPPRVQETAEDAPAFNTRSNTIRTDLEVAMCIVEQAAGQPTYEYANAAILHPDTGLSMKYRQLNTHPASENHPQMNLAD